MNNQVGPSSSGEDFEGDNLFKGLSDIPLDIQPPPNIYNITQNHPFPLPSQFIPYGEEGTIFQQLLHHPQAPSSSTTSPAQFLNHYESTEGNMLEKKQPFRRPRSAETHNLAERNRRSRLKEKIQILKEALPNCDKNDADSILTNAINYVHSSKFHLQWMSEALRGSTVDGQKCSPLDPCSQRAACSTAEINNCDGISSDHMPPPPPPHVGTAIQLPPVLQPDMYLSCVDLTTSTTCVADNIG